MAARTTKSASVKDEPILDPAVDQQENANGDDYALPNDTEWTAVCPGSVGSMPNLVDIEAQNLENQSAFREGRKARALAITCGFCHGYHVEMQPKTNVLLGGEVTNSYYLDTPPPVAAESSEPDLIQAAIDALGSDLKEEEDDDGTNKSNSSS